MITEYRIIGRPTQADLVAAVNNTIKEGWRPQGGVTHVNGSWVQAVVKETE